MKVLKLFYIEGSDPMSLYSNTLQRLFDPHMSLQKAIKRYWYLSVCGLYNDQLVHLRHSIQIKYHISSKEFWHLLIKRDEKWSSKQEICEEMIRSSSWMNQFKAEFLKLDSKTMDANKAVFLMTNLLSSVLQNASILTMHSHLKPKKVKFLLMLLTQHPGLKDVQKDLCNPIFNGALEIYPIFSKEYTIPFLALQEHLTYFYLASLESLQSPKAKIILQVIKQIKYQSPEELETSLCHRNFSF